MDPTTPETGFSMTLTRTVGEETETYVADTPIVANDLLAHGWTRVDTPTDDTGSTPAGDADGTEQTPAPGPAIAENTTGGDEPLTSVDPPRSGSTLVIRPDTPQIAAEPAPDGEQ